MCTTEFRKKILSFYLIFFLRRGLIFQSHHYRGKEHFQLFRCVLQKLSLYPFSSFSILSITNLPGATFLISPQSKFRHQLEALSSSIIQLSHYLLKGKPFAENDINHRHNVFDIFCPSVHYCIFRSDKED